MVIYVILGCFGDISSHTQLEGASGGEFCIDLSVTLCKYFLVYLMSIYVI